MMRLCGVGAIASYNTAYGRSNASWYDVNSQIDNNQPLLINDPYSQDNYGNHTMCIDGYQGGSTNYIIVHDTWPGDGDSNGNVWINYNSATDLGSGSDFCFTIITW
jgi:hypothetical protein